MRVAITNEEFRYAVRCIGGKYVKVREDAIARFQSEKGWAVDCRFSLGPSDCVFVGEKPTSSLSYNGEGNRLSSDVQDRKYFVRQQYQTQVLACTAIVAHSTRLHNKGVEEILEAANTAGQSKYRDWKDIFSLEELGCSISKINVNWSVFHDTSNLIGEHSIYGVFDTGPYLVRKGAIYIPLANGAA